MVSGETCGRLTILALPPGGVQSTAGSAQPSCQVHPVDVHIAHQDARSGAAGRRIHGPLPNWTGCASYRVRTN